MAGMVVHRQSVEREFKELLELGLRR